MSEPSAAPGRPQSPYRGLLPYEEDDAPFFFGRDSEREIIAANLLAARLTVVYGATGVGKSSVLRAGVARDLRALSHQRLRTSGLPEFVVAVFHDWHADTIAGLAASVRDAIADLGLQVQPPTDSLGLADTLFEWTQQLGCGLLILLDQFEEHFLYRSDEQRALPFAAELSRAVKRADLPVNFLLALREDALSWLDQFKGKIPGLFNNYLRIRHLSLDAARAAIRQPLVEYSRRADDGRPFTVEPALVDAVLEELRPGQVSFETTAQGGIGTRPGREGEEVRVETAFLQLVMTRLWDAEMETGSRTLRVQTLERLGGAERIVRNHLDEAMGDLSAQEQEVAARSFRYLVTPSGTKIAHTEGDLAILADLPRERVAPVLERLAQGGVRVLRAVEPPVGRPDQARYEIFHDVLVPAILDWRTRQEAAAKLTGVRRRNRRLAGLVAVLATLLALTLGLGALALVQRNRADAQGRRATSLYLLTGSESQSPDLAILLSLAAHRLWPDAGTRAGLLTQIDRRRDASALLTGHTGELRAIAYSPDGRTLASVGADNTLRLWDPSRRAPAQVLSGPPGGVSSAVFSPDGRTLAWGGDQDSRIVLWDVASRAQVRTLAGPPGGTRALAFSSDGRTLAVAGVQDTIGVLDVASRRPPTVIGRIPGASQVAFSPDGRTLVASGEQDSMIRRWRLPSRAPLRPLRGHVDGVQAIAFSPDGRTLASAGVPGDDSIRLWVLEPRIQSHELVNDWTTRALAFSPDGRTLATGGDDDDRLVVLWNVATWTRERALTEHTDTVTALAFSPDGHTLASGSADRTVALFDLTTPAFVGHTQFVTRVSFSRDGRLLASASEDGRVILWDVARRTPIRVLNGHHGDVTDVAFSSDSRLLASTSFDGRVLVWRLDQPGPPTAVPRPAGAYRIAFSPVRRMLALPGVNGTITLRDLDRGTSRILTGHDGAVLHLAFSPDGATLASAGADGTVVLHDLARGTHVSLPRQDSPVTGVAFSPDGATLASAGGKVLLWDVARRIAVATLGPGISVTFSPDSRTLAVGTSDEPPAVNSTVVLYDLDGRTPYATLDRGISAVFSPDGRTLATAGQDIVFRNLDPTSWQMRLCQLIGRELTRAEWTEHVPGRSYQTVCP
jgi:WD40 repeat protein